MGDPEQLFALLELMLRTFSSNHVPYVNIAGGPQPNVKAGGHSEEMFLDLSEEEREEIECSICYQILKDTRQCENKHNFCYGCIYVWSTSGNPSNHLRCPVCRVDGTYMKNLPVDELVNAKRVKCQLKTCSWTGPFKEHASHKHTTYTEGPADKSDFPMLNIGTKTTAKSTTSSTNRTARASSTHRSNASNTSVQRQPLTSTSNNATALQAPSNQRASVTSQNGSTTSSRVRSRSRPRQNATNVQRRAGNTSTQGRLTSRARIQNGVANSSSSTSTNNNNNNQQTTQNENVDPASRRTSHNPLTPRPPTTPRPQRQGSRRVPTLPSLVSNNDNTNENTTSYEGSSNSANNNNLSARNNNTDESSTTETNNNQVNASGSSNNTNSSSDVPQTTSTPSISEPMMRVSIEPVYIRRNVRPNPNRGFTNIRDRLNESRQRLDLLMNAFSGELDRGRNDMTAFQEERERRRQQQMAEVRDLGRRLGHVAQELRGLLSQRRQIRTQIDTLADSFTDDTV